MTEDLVAFVNARLDEDEELARSAQYNWIVVAEPELSGNKHIVRHDPARVLRGVEAKRRILGWAQTGALPPYEIDYVLTALASEWSTHEAYREEWKP